MKMRLSAVQATKEKTDFRGQKSQFFQIFSINGAREISLIKIDALSHEVKKPMSLIFLSVNGQTQSLLRARSVVARLWRASEARAAPDARNALKHVRDDVFSSFEDLDGVWSSFTSLRRTKNREEASSLVVTLNELSTLTTTLGCFFVEHCTRMCDKRDTFALLSIDGSICVAFAKILGFQEQSARNTVFIVESIHVVAAAGLSRPP